MADPVTAMVVIAGVSAAGKGLAQTASASSDMKALQLQREQNMISYQQKTLANLDMTKKIVDADSAEASVRGVGLNSPSLTAIQTNAFNVGAKNQSNLDIEQSLFEKNLKIEKENVRNTLWGNIFGDAAGIGSDAFMASKAAPKSGA